MSGLKKKKAVVHLAFSYQKEEEAETNQLQDGQYGVAGNWALEPGKDLVLALHSLTV